MKKGKVGLYKILGQTHQLHMHLRQYKTGLQYRTPKNGGKRKKRKINIH